MRWRAKPLICYLLSYVVFGPMLGRKHLKGFRYYYMFSQLLSDHVHIVVELISLVAPNLDTALILLLLLAIKPS